MNEYDGLFTNDEQRLKSNATGSEYDEVFRTDVERRKQQLGVTVRQAVAANPDTVAKQKALSTATGVPLPVVIRNEPDVEQQARAAALQKIAESHPALRRVFSNPEFAAVAHDDAETLSEVAKTVAPQRTVTSAEFTDLVRDAMTKNPVLDADAARLAVSRSVTVDNSPGGIRPVEGPKANASNVTSSLVDRLMGIPGSVRDALKYQAADYLGLDRAKGEAAKAYRQGQFADTISRPRFETETGKLVFGGAENVIQNVPIIAAAILTRNPTLGAALASLQTETSAYVKYRERGGTKGEATTGAVLEGVIEFATEKIPLSFLTESIGKVSVWKLFVGDQFREQITEQIATHSQDMVDLLVANPNATIKDYLKARPDAALQTAVAVLMQGAVIGGAGAVANALSDPAQREQERIQKAQHNAEVLQNLAKLAQSSKVLQRDPASFQEFIRQASEDGPVQDLYINGQVLMQSLQGIDPAQIPEAIRTQMSEAVSTGGDVKIPLDVYVAQMAPLDQGGVLTQHLKTDPLGMSVEEAKLFQEEQATLFQQTAEKALSTEEANTELQAQAEQVRTHFVEQLKTANRFTNDVNTAYATLMRDFYVTMAQRLGITPVEMLQRYPLKVAAENVAAQTQMDQDQSNFQNWFGDSKVVDDVGAPLRMYHGTRGDVSAFDIQGLSGVNFGDLSEGFAYFTNKPNAYPDSASDYAEPGMTGGNVIPVYLALQNPLIFAADGAYSAVFAFDQNVKEIRRRVAEGGHDGVIVRYTDGSSNEVVVGATKPEQIKSAIGNNGNFDPNNPNILEQSAKLRRGTETLKKYGLDPTKKHKTRAVAAALEARTREKYGSIAPTDRSPEAVGRIAKWMVEEVLFELEHAADSGVGWYSEKFQRALDTFAQRFPELRNDQNARDTMTALIAITSDGQKVVPNFLMAADIYANFRETGKFVTDRGHIREASILGNLEKIQNLYDTLGPAAMRETLLEERTVSEINKLAKAKGEDFSTDYQAHIKLPKAALIFGPKLGAFYANLMGSHGYLTMDRWWSRTFNRYRGTLITAPTEAGLNRFRELLGNPYLTDDETIAATVPYWESYSKRKFKDGSELEKAANTIHKAAFDSLEDAPFNSTDRTFMIDSVRQAQKNLKRRGHDISIADIQAILWYYEKRLYGDLGARQSADVSYEEAAQRAIAAGSDTGEGRADGLDAVEEPGGTSGDGATAIGTEEFPSVLEQGPAPEPVEPGTRVLFEVAPDPNNVELTRQWDLLPADQKFAISEKVAADVMPRVLAAVGSEGKLAIQYGGYMGSTNPSFSLTLPQGADPQAVIDATKLAGFALAQDSMMVTGPEAFPGASEVGVVTVSLPPDATFEDVAAVYDKLWALEANGEKLIGGHTTVNGQMAILNFSGVDSTVLAEMVNQQLGGAYTVHVDQGFAWFPEKTEYDYASDRSPQDGGEAPSESPLRATARKLRTEASRALESELAAAAAGQPAEAALAQQARGQISFGQDIKQGATISLLKNADLSTFLHETGHFFLEVMVDIAGQPNAPAQVTEDLTRLLEWFGVADLAMWQHMTLDEKRPHHEQFARGFEAYLFEGKAPSLELRGLFDRFRSWLINVYKSLSALNVKLTDEVRGVMNRMLATDKAIADAEAAAAYAPLFANAEQVGMTPEQWQEYQALGSEATENAVEDLQRRSMRDMQWASNARSRAIKEMQSAAADKRKALREEVAKEVYQTPVYAAERFLRYGTMPDGSDAKAFSDMKFKLDLAALKEEFGDGPAAIWRYLDTGRAGLAGKDGLNPAIVAEMFGFDSVDALVRKLVEAEPVREVIEGMTDQRMLERYGDLADQREIERAANEAVHNEARARFVATELNALQKATAPGKTRALMNAAKMYASVMVGRKKIKDVRPAQHVAAEARAGKAAERALAKNDVEAAAIEKRNQLLNHYMAREATEAVDSVQKALRYLKKFDNEGTRKNIDQEYIDQIDQMLERFDLRKVSDKDLRRRASLAEWIKSQEDAGFEPSISDELRAEAFRTHYSALTVEEFRGLVDSIKNIEHLGRLKKKLLTAKDDREFAARVQEAVDSIEANAKGPVEQYRTSDRGALIAAGQLFRGFTSEHRKASSLLREMDGVKDAGVMWELLTRPMNERGDFEAVEREKATMKLAALFKTIDPKTLNKKQFFAGINKSLTREERIGIALNMGNAVNKERVMSGENWNQVQVAEILDSLTQPEWQFVQGVWDYLESFRPQIAAKQKRVTGVEPQWVEGEPVTTKFGILKGGYYPIKYDTLLSSKAAADTAAEVQRQMERGLYVRAQTRRGHLEARAESTGMTMRYDLGVMTQHINQVVHDLAWHEWLIDANRLLRSKPLNNAIRTFYGPEKLQQLEAAVRDIAIGDIPAQTKFEHVLSHLRHGATIVGMGWSVTTSLLQPIGLTQSAVRIGPKWVGKGLAKWIGDPKHMTDVVDGIYAKSDFMRLRGKTMQRELSEIRNVIANKDSAIENSYFWLIQKMQMVADVPTWLGAYEKAMAQPTMTEDRAAALADQAVIDSQGGGQIKDLAKIQRGGPLLKLWTSFYSYFNVTYNLAAERTRATNFKNPAQIGALAVDYLMLFTVPAVLGALMKTVLKGDDEDELAATLAREQLNYLFGTLVGLRELGAAVQGFTGYTGPAGTRFFSEVTNLVKQVGQGEVDEAAIKAVANTAGTVFHLPTGQVVRTLDGIHALATGKTENPGALLVGSKEN
jgi:hypothetical protein